MPFFINRPIMPLPVGGGLDADIALWVTAVTGDGGTVTSPHQTVLSDMVAGLKSDGVWTDIRRLWWYAIDDFHGAKFDLVVRAIPAAVQATPIFTANQGYVSDGGGGSFDTGFQPDTSLTFPSGSIFAWSDVQAANTGGLIGDQTNGYGLVHPRYTGDLFYFGFGDGFPNVANTDGRGLFTASRTTASLVTGYRNGTQMGTGTNTVSGFFAGGQNVWTLRSGASYFTAGNVMLAGIANSLTGAQVSSLYSRTHTALVAIAGISY